MKFKQLSKSGVGAVAVALAAAAGVAAIPQTALAQTSSHAKAKSKASAIAPLPSTGAGASTPDPGNAPAPGGTASNAVLLYSGSPLSSGQIQATAWGGGSAVDHDGDAYSAAGHTIQIDTAGLYQGGQIVFSTPVDLGAIKTEQTRYLQIIFSAAPSQKYPRYGGYRTTGSLASPAASASRVFDAHSIQAPGAEQIAQMGYRPSGGYRGGRGGYRPGVPSTPGVPGYGARPTTPTDLDDTAALPNVPINSLHVIYEYADGTRSETLRPITVTLGEDVNWIRAGIPLSAIPLAPSGDAQLAKLYIGSDLPATLNIGEIRLVSDTTPITADAGRDKTIPLNTSVTLVGTGEGGASSLKYEWNFDSPSAQPFVPEQQGVKVSYTFSTPGDHIVTLRVSDLDGIKSPATSTVTIHVVDQGVAPQGGQGYPGQRYPGAGPSGGYAPGGFTPGGGGRPD